MTPMSSASPTPLIVRVARTYLMLAFPVLIIVGAVRLVMTPVFLHIEYTRPGFPTDFYGLTTDDRLLYAPYALDYLIYNHPVEYLADLRFRDGTTMYNARELHHMRDVQIVTQGAFLVGSIGAGLALAAVLMLLRLRRSDTVRAALRDGAAFTLLLIGGIVLLAVLSWDMFFTAFHELFFADGTWIFLYSDTLIRLFPEQFWFDAALIIGGITVGLAIITFAVTIGIGRGMLRRRALRGDDPQPPGFDIPAG